MAFEYDKVVPWGRNFDEYCRMFDLQPTDLEKRILGCGDGPASFNCVCNARGGHVVSVDPLFTLTSQEILARIHATYDTVIAQTRNNQEKFIWTTIASVDELGRMRMEAMMQFLATYEAGRIRGEYIPGSLPVLDLHDNSFDLALSSHFLFLYSDNLDYEFHLRSIREMLRVSREARIFPLLDYNAKRSRYINRIIRECSEFAIDIRKVPYEFQQGGDEMMVVRKR